MKIGIITPFLDYFNEIIRDSNDLERDEFIMISNKNDLDNVEYLTHIIYGKSSDCVHKDTVNIAKILYRNRFSYIKNQPAIDTTNLKKAVNYLNGYLAVTDDTVGMSWIDVILKEIDEL